MLYPSLEVVQEFLQSYRTVPVFSSQLMDCKTPVGIFSTLKAYSETCFLLESVENSERWGRYSFIGIHPKAQVTIQNGTATFTQNGTSQTERIENPASYLSKIMEQYRSPVFAGFPRFTGGLVGYFGYDMLRYLENTLKAPPEDDLLLPDCVLDLYDEVIAFDHLSSKVFVILNIHRDSDAATQYALCERRAKELFRKIGEESAGTTFVKNGGDPIIHSNTTPEQYADMVNRAKEHILAGDIFQVVLSQRFEIENPPEPFLVYRVLRATNPSPYLYYFQSKAFQIAGASPEMLVNVEDGFITNKPIAGTIRRGKEEAEDKMLEQQLLQDEKERAEHTMLVDLGRNDVGRVSRFGSVQVADFMHVERCSQVMHLVTEVHGTLQNDKTSVDALLSILPAGTLSGAPKIRAMQIIDELEPKKRGVYGGAIGYLGFDGNIDTCIAIRTALFRNGKAYVQAGAGIVADSIPEKEYLETRNKAQAVINAIREANEL